MKTLSHLAATVAAAIGAGLDVVQSTFVPQMAEGPSGPTSFADAFAARVGDAEVTQSVGHDQTASLDLLMGRSTAADGAKMELTANVELTTDHVCTVAALPGTKVHARKDATGGASSLATTAVFGAVGDPGQSVHVRH